MKRALFFYVFLWFCVSAYAQFNETYSPVDFMVSPQFLGSQTILGADGDYYFLSNSVASYSLATEEQKFSARFVECGGSQARLRDLEALPDGRYYAAGTAFTPDSASCGAELQQGGGSYDAILGYFSASGRMIWGHTFSEVQVQDSWQDLFAMPDGSVYATGNQFKNLRITQFDSTKNIRFDSVYAVQLEGFLSTRSSDNKLHFISRTYEYVTFDIATKEVTTTEIQPAAGVGLETIYTYGDFVELPSGNLAFGITYETSNPFLRSLRVIKINRAGEMLDVYPRIDQEPIVNHFARDIKMIDDELWVLGGVGDGVVGIFAGITLSALDPLTFEPRFTDLFTGQGVAAYNLESFRSGTDTVLIHGSGGNGSGSYNNFPARNGAIGPIKYARCSVASSFGYEANGRATAFTNFSSSDAIDFEWDFGDGSTSFLDNPSHTYSADGTYTVCLRSRTRNYCEAAFCLPVQIPNGVSSSSNVVEESSAFQVTQSGDQLTLKHSSNSFRQVELLDLSGRSQVLYQEANQSRSLILSTGVLPKGLYILSAVLGDGQQVAKRVFIE